MNQRPTIASYWVLDLVQLWSLGVLVAKAERAHDAGMSALADLTAQAIRCGLGWS